jgi:S-disulfanyl-L-cysteine oxidoreductase SoxD
MSMHERTASTILLALALGWGTAVAAAEGQKFGQPIAPADFAAWDISLAPDGVGLPAGSGTPTQGAAIYAQKCVTCHGERGAGGPGGALVGGGPLSGGDRDPAKLIGNYWPYATTIFDFTRRAMPWAQPKSLTNDEVYALTAYVLALNKIIGENDAMNAETLPRVRMPNRDGFIPLYPGKH